MWSTLDARSESAAITSTTMPPVSALCCRAVTCTYAAHTVGVIVLVGVVVAVIVVVFIGRVVAGICP